MTWFFSIFWVDGCDIRRSVEIKVLGDFGVI